ncbi:MAG TPA: glycosyltransferase family 39 protein [Anaerolineales bacterium]|nr:glycosyltransferase family 39 protein [Anaerolineales bacterium]
MIIRSTFWRDNTGLWAALVVGLTLKAVLLALDVFPFNADEAVVALMARHILQGERPVFFYGQAYLGSADAWLIAVAFLIFGEHVIAIRIAQSVLYLGTLFTTYWLGRKIYQDHWVATAAALLLALPTVLVTLYTTATLGGYGETLLIGNILLLWTLRLRDSTAMDTLRRLEWLVFGALAGFGFWTFGLLGVYLLPIGAALFFRSNDLRENLRALLSANYSLAALGFVGGSSPWWWATVFGAATVSELGGSAIAESMPGGPIAAMGLRLFSLIVLGLPVIVGLRPPWAVRWLGLPLAPLALVIFLGTVGWAIKMCRTHGPTRLLAGVCLIVCGAFVATPFGNDPSGRYFLPLIPPLALFIAGTLNRVRREYPRLALGLLFGLLGFNLWGNLDSAFTFPPGISTQFDRVAQVDQRDMPEVIEFLRSQGEIRGYGNYWVSFPMAFLSGEQLIFTAALPYHEDFRYTPRDNRYAPYREMVMASDRVAYLTTNHPTLNDYLRAQFRQKGISFEEKAIGDFRIFYSLSRRVTPEELGIYEQAPDDTPPATPR